ncbi:MAG: hypothetical protein GY772_25435 [bacterium]|nr:hypothetical protein [bacterium]
MSDVPRWAWSLPSNLRKAELEALVSDAERLGHTGRPAPGARVADLRAWLSRCRTSFWEARSTDAAPSPASAPARPAARESLCEIPASEVNEWLRGLPAVL